MCQTPTLITWTFLYIYEHQSNGFYSVYPEHPEPIQHIEKFIS